MTEIISDDAIILNVKPYQIADKYVTCYTREHGKLHFIAYGARYPKNVNGRLLQPFFCVRLEAQQGSHIDKLRSAELIKLPDSFDVTQMAYAAVAAELVSVLTEVGEPQEEIFTLLQQTLLLIKERNPRVIIQAFAIKLLHYAGLSPQIETCVHCGEVIEEDAWFSALQGGAVCKPCYTKMSGGGMDGCGQATRELWRSLLFLNMESPERFMIKGATLMELEKLLYKYILFQTDKPLNSVNFLNQLGL